MNGYQMSAESYRKLLATEQLTGQARTEIESKIAALEVIAGMDPEQQHQLFNTGAFNDIVKGYALMALNDAGIDKTRTAKVMRLLDITLDTILADEAEQYYNDH